MNDATNDATNEFRTILEDQVNRLFSDMVTKDLQETAETGEWPAALWQAIEENGLPGILVPEEAGGSGAGWADAQVVIRAAGRYRAPVPLAETILASWLLAGAGLEVPPGPLTVAPSQAGDVLSLRHDGDTWRLSGAAARVPWGARADHVVAVAGLDGEAHVALVANGAYEASPETNVAAEPRDSLRFDDAAVAAAPAAPGLGYDAAFRYGALLRSVQMAGALEFLLSESVQYAKDRVQFGRTISKFQAVQQELARLAGQLAAASAAAEAACVAADKGDAAFEIAVAKIRAGEAATQGTSIAHQTHGAIGFTYEHALHFATRRLWSWRAEFGSEKYWAEKLGRELAGRGGDALWPFLTERG